MIKGSNHNSDVLNFAGLMTYGLQISWPSLKRSFPWIAKPKALSFRTRLEAEGAMAKPQAGPEPNPDRRGSATSAQTLIKMLKNRGKSMKKYRKV